MKKKILNAMIVICCLLTMFIPAKANADTFETNTQTDKSLSRDCILPQEYVQYCEEIGKKYCISPFLLEAIIEKESSGNPNATNGTCCGLMQVDETWHAGRMEKLGVTNIFDPYGNILVSTDYIMELAGTYEDVSTVLMIYNGTPEHEAIRRSENGDFTEYATWILKRVVVLEEK